jgi:D-glycero-D-manno-heptose 1,7-bisphosphate phosphatase
MPSLSDAHSRFHDELGLWTWIRSEPFDKPRAALFLDRDGVIIEDPGYLCDPAAMIVIPGAARLIASANQLGVPVVVITNQAGIGRGYYGWNEFIQVEEALMSMLAAEDAHLDAVLACPYHRDGVPPWNHPQHPARKPAPGMFLAADQFLHLDLSQSWIVGDSWSDLLAGYHAGLRGGTHVLTGKGVKHRPKVIEWQPRNFDLQLADSISSVGALLRTIK